MPSNLDDMMSADVMTDPHSYNHRLRAADPVYWNAKWGGWVLTRYTDIVQVLRDAENFSSDRMAFLEQELPKEDIERFQPIFRILANWMVFSDPPRHTHLRKLLNSRFTPKAIEMWRPRVRQIVNDVIDTLPRDKTIDLVHDFSYLVPLTVILDMLDAPALDRDLIKHWSEQIGVFFFIRADEPKRREIACEGVNSFVAYLEPLVAERRKRPGTDMISALVQAQDDGGLTDDEVIATCVLLVFGGHETTMNLINNGTLAFIQHPDQWEKLAKHPELIVPAVEEILRFDSSVKSTVRWVKNEVGVGGKTIKKNERLLLVLAAANRDPEQFAEPDALDITRDPNPHVAFAHGIHVCLGGPLARLEAQEAFLGMTQRLPLPTLETSQLDYHPAIISRALKTLPVAFRN